MTLVDMTSTTAAATPRNPAGALASRAQATAQSMYFFIDPAAPRAEDSMCDASMRELSKRFTRVATTSHAATTRPVNGFAPVLSENGLAASIVSGVHR